MIAYLLAISLPICLFVVCAVLYIVHTRKRGRQLAASIVAHSVVLALSACIAMISVVGYMQENHPACRDNILVVDGSDVVFNVLDGEYFVIEKKPLNILTPFELRNATQDEIENINTARKSKMRFFWE